MLGLRFTFTRSEGPHGLGNKVLSRLLHFAARRLDARIPGLASGLALAVRTARSAEVSRVNGVPQARPIGCLEVHFMHSHDLDMRRSEAISSGLE
jgi:hypothetical protein